MDENKIKKVRAAINDLVKAKEELRKLGVLRSERVTGEIGEWFVEILTGAKRAESTSQRGYDLLDDDKKKYQVKCHAKGDENKARWTQWSYQERDFDEILILVFNKELYLKEAYRLLFKNAQDKVDKSKKQVVLKWDKCSDYKIKDIPAQLECFISQDDKNKFSFV